MGNVLSEAMRQRPTSQAIEAETYVRKDPGNGGRQGWDERAISAQVAARPNCYVEVLVVGQEQTVAVTIQELKEVVSADCGSG